MKNILFIKYWSVCLIKKNYCISIHQNNKFNSITSGLFKYSNLPLCINCKHFIEHKPTYTFNDMSNYSFNDISNNSMYGKCDVFGKINLVTGEKKYYTASLCREYNNLCGEKAINYSPKS